MDGLAGIRLEFNRYLLDAIGGKILDTSVFGWDAGLTKWMLGMCMAIAFFQSVLRDERSMLVEWTKIVIASWFAMAILGGVDYKNVYGLKSLGNVPAEYQVKTTRTKPTLERAMFNFLSWKFDTLGKAIILDNNGQEGSLSKEITELATIQDRLADAVLDCQPHDTGCLRNKLSGVETEVQAEKDEIPSGFGAIPWVIGKVSAFMAKIYNPAYWVFPILTFILELVRGFVNMFVLVTFGIIAAMSLFFLKILSVFMVIPSYRGRVLGMWKTAMAASMYGFAMNLVIWISVIITKALNEATVNIVIKSLTNSSMGGSSATMAAEITTMMMANFLTAFVIMAMQIVALAKVPSLCNKLMNLSLEEIVNIGETLVSAGLGIAKIAAGMAAGVGGLALGGVGAMAAKSLTGKSTSELGESAGNFFKKLSGGASSDEQKSFKASRAKSEDDGGDGGSGSGLIGSGPKRGGGQSMEGAALADANMKATVRGGNKSILKNKEGEEVEEPNRPKTQLEKQIQRSDSIDTAAKRISQYMPKSVGGAMLDLAFDGMSGGAGGDPTGSMRNMVTSTAATFGEQKGDMSKEINSQAEGMGQKAFNSFNPLRKPDNAERANNAESVYRQAIVGGKREVSAEDSAQLQTNLKAISEGKATNDQMLEVVKSQNTMKLDEGQRKQIDDAKKSSEVFSKFSADEDAANAQLMKKVQSEMSSGNMSSATLSDLSSRTSAGMIDYDAIAKMEVGPKDGVGPKSTMATAMGGLANRELNAAIDPLAKKVASGKALTRTEQQSANNMFEQQQNRLVGDKPNLEKFKSVLAGQVKTDHLETSREDATYVVEETLKNIEESMSKGDLDAPITDNFQLSLGSKNEKGLVRSTGEVDGMYINGQAVTSAEEYSKLDAQSRQMVDDLFNMANMVTQDKETNNMMKDKMSNLRLGSDNLAKIQKLGAKLRGGK